MRSCERACAHGAALGRIALLLAVLATASAMRSPMDCTDRPPRDQLNIARKLVYDKEYERAEECIELSMAQSETLPAYTAMVGLHRERGDSRAVLRWIEHALAKFPDAYALWWERAVSLANVGDIKGAIAAYEAVIDATDEYDAAAHNNLGLMYGRLERAAESITHLREALRIDPQLGDAAYNLANAHKKQGRYADAIAMYERAIDISDSVSAYVNLAACYEDMGERARAIRAYERAIEEHPDHADCYYNLGNLLLHTGRHDDAARQFEQALKLAPRDADVLNNLATAYQALGRNGDVVEMYRKLLKETPDHAQAVGNYFHTKQYICDWSNRDEEFAKLRDVVNAHLRDEHTEVPSIRPFHALAYPFSSGEVSRIAERTAVTAEEKARHMELADVAPPRQLRKGSRIRVGYVSADFGVHPVGYLMGSLLERHDREHVRVYCFALRASDQSAVARRIYDACHEYIDLSVLSTQAAARAIADARLHVLVDLNGYTDGSRTELFALHLVPVQIHAFGFASTMGASFIQHMVTDRVAVPPEHTPALAEKVLYLPDSYLANDLRETYLRTAEQSTRTRAEYGVPDDAFVLCSFNQLWKLDPQTFDMWLDILRRVPSAVLWLLNSPADAEANLRAHAERAGIDTERLVFSAVVEKEEHIERVHLADLFLDNIFYTGHTGSLDALFGGLPVLTLAGERMSSRVTASFLSTLGLAADLVVHSRAEYVAQAVALARQPATLRHARRVLAEARRSSHLFDMQRFATHMDTAYRMLAELGDADSRADVRRIEWKHVIVCGEDCGVPGGIDEGARLALDQREKERLLQLEMQERAAAKAAEEHAADATWEREKRKRGGKRGKLVEEVEGSDDAREARGEEENAGTKKKTKKTQKTKKTKKKKSGKGKGRGRKGALEHEGGKGKGKGKKKKKNARASPAEKRAEAQRRRERARDRERVLHEARRRASEGAPEGPEFDAAAGTGRERDLFFGDSSGGDGEEE